MSRHLFAAAGPALPAVEHIDLMDQRTLARLRKAAADRVDALIAFLDATAGDPDVEDDDGCEDGWDEEPSLGALETQLDVPAWQMVGAASIIDSGAPRGHQLDWAGKPCAPMDADREEDIQDEPHDAGFEGNDEPSLGWPDLREDQSRGGFGTDDLEDEHDGCEPEEDGGVDDEPHDGEEPDSFYSATPDAPFHTAARFEHEAI